MYKVGDKVRLEHEFWIDLPEHVEVVQKIKEVKKDALGKTVYETNQLYPVYDEQIDKLVDDGSYVTKDEYFKVQKELKGENMKKYIVGLEAGYFVAEFEFESQKEAIEFMEAAHDHYTRTSKGDYKLSCCMRLEGEE